MNDDERVSDVDINRMLDGELSQARRAEVQSRLALQPDDAARVFSEAQRMEAIRAVQPHRLLPPAASVEGARRLEKAFRRKRLFRVLRLQVAAVFLLALGWGAHSLSLRVWQSGQTVDDSFVLAAREALQVAQLDAGPKRGVEPTSAKIARLSGVLNIAMPPLPSTWHVTDVQLQPWSGRQRLVVSATTPRLGDVTLVAVPMQGEQAVPPTSTDDGRIPTVYWQSGGTAFALMGPTETERLEREALGIEIASRKKLGSKIRG